MLYDSYWLTINTLIIFDGPLNMHCESWKKRIIILYKKWWHKEMNFFKGCKKLRSIMSDGYVPCHHVTPLYGKLRWTACLWQKCDINGKLLSCNNMSLWKVKVDKNLSLLTSVNRKQASMLQIERSYMSKQSAEKTAICIYTYIHTL